MPGIGVINNPKSRQNQKHPERIKTLGYILGTEGSSKATNSLDELEDCLKDFKKRKIDILAINGGDGSNHLTLTKLIEVYKKQPLPKIALLRGGTLNTISTSFGIKGDPKYLLHNLSYKYAEGLPFETHQADLMNVNGKYCFLFGNGFVANFMHTYYKTGTPSPWQGIKTAAKGIASAIVNGKLVKEWFRPVHAKVTVDGNDLGITRFSSMLSGTMEDIGVGFKPWNRAFDVPNTFHIHFMDCSPFDLLPDVPLIWFGRPIHPKCTQEFLAKHVTIEAEEGFHYTQDGDMYFCEDGKMDISLGPRIEIIIS